MDELRLAREAEQPLELARRPARDQPGFAAAVVGKTARELDAIKATHRDHVAAMEITLDLEDDVDELVRILSAGVNVVATAAGSCRPPAP